MIRDVLRERGFSNPYRKKRCGDQRNRFFHHARRNKNQWDMLVPLVTRHQLTKHQLKESKTTFKLEEQMLRSSWVEPTPSHRTCPPLQDPGLERGRLFAPSHLPFHKFLQPRSRHGTLCAPTSQQQHRQTDDGQGRGEDGHISKHGLKEGVGDASDEGTRPRGVAVPDERCDSSGS